MSGMSSRFVENFKLSKVKIVSAQFNFVLTFSLSFECLFLPNLLFSKFIFRPKVSSVVSAACKELVVPSRKSVVSSASCQTLKLYLPTLIPIIWGFLSIKSFKISVAKLNKYAAIGSPCLQLFDLFNVHINRSGSYWDNQVFDLLFSP